MNKLLIANWKMQLSHNESIAWINDELPGVLDTIKDTDNELIICPSFTVLPYAHEVYPTGAWGAQDCGPTLKGPYTGDVSVLSLKDLGVSYTLVGHSERREHHGETDKLVADKTALLLKHGIHPIVCIGETQEQSAQRAEVLERQLEQIIPLYTRPDDVLIVAYEPVWAIGTGKTPTAYDLQEAVESIYELCGDLGPYILYGGSVNGDNVKNLSPLVDGFLIGSASLNSELLKKIILSC